MNINKTSMNIGFNAGFKKQILELEKNTNPAKIKAYFKQSPYTDWHDFNSSLNFNDNKAYALACRMCAKIFIELRKKHDYRHYSSAQNLVFPRGIYVFNKEELHESHKDKANVFFTTNVPQHDILSNGQSFDRQTIFLNNFFSSLEEVNYQMNENKSNGILSTGHFLHFFVHEWIHAIQGKLLYNITHDLNGGDYDLTRMYNLGQKVSDKENEIVADVLGKYATVQDNTLQYAEIFAEAWTKFICNSLNEECNGFKSDPIDELKKTPKEFREILKKVSTISLRRIWHNENSRELASWKDNVWSA